MSELALTLVRLGFLVLLWAFVLTTVLVLRRDLRQPADARPLGRERKAPRAAKPPRPPKVAKQQKVKGSKLVVIEGPLQGTIVPLGNVQITIGRAPDSTLIIDDDYASSRHARVYPSEGSWVVEDLGSTNGTFVNRQKVNGPQAFRRGDRLQVGNTVMELV